MSTQVPVNKVLDIPGPYSQDLAVVSIDLVELFPNITRRPVHVTRLIPSPFPSWADINGVRDIHLGPSPAVSPLKAFERLNAAFSVSEIASVLWDVNVQSNINRHTCIGDVLLNTDATFGGLHSDSCGDIFGTLGFCLLIWHRHQLLSRGQS